MKFNLVSIICFLWIAPYYAQLGELERYDCTYSKEITVPFNDFESQSTNTKPQLNQVVFYSYRDQFTYWYKITAKTNEKISFNVSAINDSDSYVVYIYQYNNTDFCKKLYYSKIKPITEPYYLGMGGEQSGASYHSIDIKKDNIYYISVLNTSLNNCGHHLNLCYSSDTLKVKAYHTPCKKDISTLPIVKKVIKPLLKKDTTTIQNSKAVSESKNQAPIIIATIEDTKKDTLKTNINNLKNETFQKKTKCLVKDKKKLNLINSNIEIVDINKNEALDNINSNIGQYEFVFEKNKKYKIKCTKLGYNDLQTYIDFINQDSIELFLEPLKVGDNFIMKSIYFHPNTYALRKESNTELQRLLYYLIENPSITIEIQGHTNGDNKIYINKAYEKLGEEWNFHGSSKNLSFKRAETIKNYLINNGITPERLFPVGHGGSKPIIENPETMEEGQKNIRVEVVILKN